MLANTWHLFVYILRSFAQVNGYTEVIEFHFFSMRNNRVDKFFTFNEVRTMGDERGSGRFKSMLTTRAIFHQYIMRKFCSKFELSRDVWAYGNEKNPIIYVPTIRMVLNDFQQLIRQAKISAQ